MTPNNGFIPLSSAEARPLLAARQKQNTSPTETEAGPEKPAKGKGQSSQL
jgi:hypothetical protein